MANMTILEPFQNSVQYKCGTLSKAMYLILLNAFFFCQVPPGLTICKSELGDIAGGFLRLINYNKSVFGDFYNQIIENHCIFQVEA